MRTIVVVDKLEDWTLSDLDIETIPAETYLSNPEFLKNGSAKILNLCRSYGYQKLGYYVSLVATARGHKPQPSLMCIEDLKSDSMIRMVSKEMDDLINQSLKRLEGDSFVLSIYFGQSLAKCHARLASYLCKQFPAPFLQARFSRNKDKWILVNIYPLSTSKIPEDHRVFAREQTAAYLKSGTVLKRAPTKSFRYSMAILANPNDVTPPSDSKAIQKFVKAAEEQSFGTEVIGPGDFGRIAEFDALFIRETTAVNHHTFRFARRAAAHGIVVMDDPQSILRCSNKIYLAELMQKYQLSTPKTWILNAESIKKTKTLPPFPFVLKVPDGCFSNGVVLIKSLDDYKEHASAFFKLSDLLIAQEFMPSEYDWRIGLLNGQVLFACKYFMVKNHWQIYRANGEGKKALEGDSAGIPLAKVPVKAKKLAQRVAQLIGTGLYGIDIEEVNGEFYVIEINDNPSIETGCEDEILGDRLYQSIMVEFKRRVEAIAR